LTIIFTTRSSRKGSETQSILEKHQAKHRTQASRSKVYFQPEILELTSLLSVRELSRKLLASDLPYLNAIILNAGIGGWSGVKWVEVTWKILTGIRQATTFPTFKLGVAGLITNPQIPKDNLVDEEPVLGQLFCANLFGHYMLVHWLWPVFRACPPDCAGKVIWTTSIEAVREHYNPSDHQALQTDEAYESTKRLTDILVLTASENQPAVSEVIKTFTTPTLTVRKKDPRPTSSQPSFYLAHPGICCTPIIELYWIIQQFYLLGILLARWCGSPWANVFSYNGAAAATWLAFASHEEIEAKGLEATGVRTGNCKWGSSSTRLGHTTVRPTDVQDWGLNGTGKSFKDSWWGGGHVGRKTGARDATAEDVERFLAAGAAAWEKMEDLKKDWEARIEKYEAQLGT
jgi:3-keto steroid reductase